MNTLLGDRLAELIPSRGSYQQLPRLWNRLGGQQFGSRQSIYDLMRRDPSFPRPRQIGSEFSVGRLRGEVMEWLNSRPRAEFNGLDAVQRRRRARGPRAAA